MARLTNPSTTGGGGGGGGAIGENWPSGYHVPRYSPNTQVFFLNEES